VAIGDLWRGAGVESVTAYIEEGENEPSRHLAASLGFRVRSQCTSFFERSGIDEEIESRWASARLRQRSGMSPDDLTLADAVEWRPVFRHKPRPVKRGGSAISLVWPDWGFRRGRHGRRASCRGCL
jgi:hypothetical protein